MTIDDQERAELLAARYGTHRPVARLVTLVVVVIVAVVALGWLAWAAWFHSSESIDADIVGFEVRGPHQVRTTLALRVADTSTTGTCLLRASAEDHSIVGEQSVPVKGLSGTSQRYVDVRTERAATTVEVARCSSD
ncbi:hypothetical protein GCM10011519_30020 [Marmoricola endophyticus]|uniref:DUF4307 domain-containing protein n=1 Tax=Marmoricola endophyticus TaxID=2040280 RepID=A0A917F7U0_9ACTN|nr:DUF4307 domain-containing protein [Marmoricola endophyticus]GGF54095.1 hypothetical protein GCM10011519_30020 [Marmoricola endophyticus]